MDGRPCLKADVVPAEAAQPVPVALAATWSPPIDQTTKYKPDGRLTVTRPVAWRGDRLAPGGILAAGPHPGSAVSREPGRRAAAGRDLAPGD